MVKTKLTMIKPRLSPIDARTVKPLPWTYATRLATEPHMGFYSSPEWRTLRDRVYAQRGRRCEDCGRTGTRIFADHVVELKDGGAPLDEGNVRLRCGSCHTAKSYDARAQRLGLR
jgi:5-methylcytosine-specific restriction enzyme A